MFDPMFLALGWLPILGTVAFAWWKGGPAERWGSLLFLVCALGTLAATTLPREAKLVAFLAADGIPAIGFLVLAMRYTSLWVGGSMLFQAAQFSLQAYLMVAAKPVEGIYVVINNINTTGVELCIVLGVLVSWRQRVVRRRKDAAKAAKTAAAAPPPEPVAT
jgi:hypothetical protein